MLLQYVIIMIVKYHGKSRMASLKIHGTIRKNSMFSVFECTGRITNNNFLDFLLTITLLHNSIKVRE